MFKDTHKFTGLKDNIYVTRSMDFRTYPEQFSYVYV